MIARRVKTAEELESDLRSAGYEPTEHYLMTGRVWRSKDTGKHIIVPDSYDGYYPDFVLEDIKDYVIDTRSIIDDDSSGSFH